MKTSLDHLPEAKRERLAAIAALLKAEAGVEMVILFGSYARGTWVEDRVTGYRSDFDLLAVVATEQLARKEALWATLAERARALSGGTPVTLIAHDIKELNQEIRNGQYFFVDIVRDGILLFDSRRHALAAPKVLGPEERLRLAVANFQYWFGSASEFWRTAGQVAARGQGPQAAFLLHPSVERFYAATLLVFTGYKPKSHNIEELADQAAPLHPALAGALPRAEAEDRRLFLLLKRAYIDARYSKKYRIAAEELRILREHVRDLAVRVREACADKLASFCGPEAVAPLPEAPLDAEVGELPEPPSLEDAAAFEAWRRSLFKSRLRAWQDRGQASRDRGGGESRRGARAGSGAADGAVGPRGGGGRGGARQDRGVSGSGRPPAVDCARGGRGLHGRAVCSG